MNSEKGVIDRINHCLKTSVTLKLMWIGFMILMLLIPTSMISSLIFEREQRSQAAIEEISSKWGGSQTIGGPVLSIPIKFTYRDPKGNVTGTSIVYSHHLPQKLEIQGEIKSEVRYRGIYQAVLYNAPLSISGFFLGPDLSHESGPDREILWQDSVVSFSVPDMRGIKDQVALKWDGKEMVFNPGIPTQDLFSTGLAVPVRLSLESANKEFPFTIQLNLNGSRTISFLPLGKTTSVHLRSRWVAPSFVGDFLPEKREVGPNGFDASWQVLHFNRTYPQDWIGKAHVVTTPEFGVELFKSVDHYQKTTRSVKYAMLFLFLTFLVFFF